MIRTEIRGHAGIITLDRPKALNALSHEMANSITLALEDWSDDDTVQLVIVRGAGERGLCAGGDVAALREDALNDGHAGADFWADEYRLNLMISQFPKPYVAIMNGIVLGGGVGISAHGSHRIVTDSTRLGMPETGIGFAPDVGGSWILGHAPDNLGVHYGLTGIHEGGAQAIEAGLADYLISDQDIEALVGELCQTGQVGVIEKYAVQAPVGFGPRRAEINRIYSADSVEEILSQLDAHEEEWAADAAKRIRRNSPLALKVTLESIRRARSLTLADALRAEYRVSCHLQQQPDFAEGVRAQIIDKDRNPQWQPATLEDVTTEHIDAIFAPLEKELEI
ncbi:enoyl-CoA hydratase/isomerase family protein [Corynebacterium sp. H128]|uniref:enoyl-CoA hydratase/isomerase family protein n=1 Tax=unclassified Corynebacterium TaxID=2624378 RepID=UPI0030A136E8